MVSTTPAKATYFFCYSLPVTTQTGSKISTFNNIITHVSNMIWKYLFQHTHLLPLYRWVMGLVSVNSIFENINHAIRRSDSIMQTVVSLLKLMSNYLSKHFAIIAH